MTIELYGALIFGLIIGSFLNVVIYRLPLMLFRFWREECSSLLQEHMPETALEGNLCWPRSFCPSCSTKIPAYFNIPILGFLILKAKCHACNTPISWRYLVVELLMALLMTMAIYKFGLSVKFVAASILFAILLALSFIDYEHKILPDDLTLPLLWLGLLVNSDTLFISPKDAIWGAVLGYGSLWLIYYLYKYITGKEGLGYGDFKLLAALGAWLGPDSLLFIILSASLAGTIIGALLIATKKATPITPLPFGPYLALAGCIELLYGESIINRYLLILSGS